MGRAVLGDMVVFGPATSLLRLETSECGLALLTVQQTFGGCSQRVMTIIRQIE